MCCINGYKINYIVPHKINIVNMSMSNMRHDQNMMILVARYQITGKDVIFITRY